MGKGLITTALAITLSLVALTACGGDSAPNSLLGATGDHSRAESRQATDIEAVSGELAELAPPEGTPTEVFSQLKQQFLQALRDEAEQKQATGLTRTEEAVNVTDLTMEILPSGGSVKLCWHYRNEGDYDQDGVVSVSDIVPLARLQGVYVSDPDTAAGICDGNRDGRVTVADIVAIARFYGAEVAGYEVRVGNSELAGYFDPYYDPITSVGITEGNSVDGGRRRFEIVLAYAYYWIRVNPVNSRFEAGPLSDCAVSTQTYDISGSVRGPDMQPLERVEVSLDEVDVVYTDSGGDYLFTDISFGVHTVRPSYPGLLFFPQERTVEVENRDMEFCSFEGAPEIDGTWFSKRILGDGSIAYLAVVEGRPAVVVSLWLGYAYMISDDPAGQSWSAPRMLLDDSVTVLGLNEVAGRPALFWENRGSDDIYYFLGDDAEGSTWSEPVLVAETEDQGGLSFAVVGGTPTLVYIDNEVDEMKYTRADSELGTDTWSSPVEIAGQTDDIGTFSLADICGNPAVAFIDKAEYCVRYTERREPSSYWSVPVEIGSLSGYSSAKVGLAEVEGNPFAVYFDSYRQRAYSTSRVDEQTGAWSAPELLNRWYSMYSMLLDSSGERVAVLGRSSGGLYLASLEDGDWKYALLEHAYSVSSLVLYGTSLYLAHRGEDWSPYTSYSQEVGVFQLYP